MRFHLTADAEFEAEDHWDALEKLAAYLMAHVPPDRPENIAGAYLDDFFSKGEMAINDGQGPVRFVACKIDRQAADQVLKDELREKYEQDTDRTGKPANHIIVTDEQWNVICLGHSPVGIAIRTKYGKVSFMRARDLQ